MPYWYWVVLGCLFTFAFEAIGHYLPRAKEIERDSQNRLLLTSPEVLGRYIYGTGIMFIGFGITQVGPNGCPPVLALALVIATAGLTVLACYGWDHLIKRLRRVRKHEAIDNAKH